MDNEMDLQRGLQVDDPDMFSIIQKEKVIWSMDN